MKRFILTIAIAAVCLFAVSVEEANARWRLLPRFRGGWSCGPGGCMPAARPAVKPAPPDSPTPAPATWLKSTDQPPVAPAK